jgi:hypothetical protein
MSRCLYVNKNVHLPSKFSCFRVSDIKLVAWLTAINVHCLQHFIREAMPSALPLDDKTTEFFSMKHLGK